MVSGFVAKRLRPHEVMVHSEKAGLAARLLSLCEERGITLATAESLTGGMLVARLVDVPGASAVVQGGVCTYSFDAKASLLASIALTSTTMVPCGNRWRVTWRLGRRGYTAQTLR